MNFQVFDAAIFKIATWQATMNIELAVHSCICGWEGCSLGKVRGPKTIFHTSKICYSDHKTDHNSDFNEIVSYCSNEFF